MPPVSSSGAGGASSSVSQLSSLTTPKWTDDLWGFRAIVLYVLFCGGMGLGFVVPGIGDEALRVSLWSVEPPLLILTLLLLLVLYYVDPGIVPPSTVKDPEIVEAERGQVGTDLVIDSHGQWARRRLLLDGRSEITQRYCNTCNIWREPRTSHCSRCGYCMERFDHHCAAVGVCIARKNHRFFTLWLFAASSASALFLWGCVSRLRELDWSRGLSTQSATTFVLLLLSLMYFYTSLLFFFAVMHCSILLCDFTTKQYLTRSRPGKSGEWPRLSLRSWCDNLRGVCCADVRSKHHILVFDSMSRERTSSSTV